MATHFEFAVFTLLPIFVMAIMIAYSSINVYRHNDRRPILLIALLSFMTFHQILEIFQFTGGTYYQTTSLSAEVFETGANVLASVATYFVLQQITDLRTTRTELETSHLVLKERSAMVSVLHRVLRHNVRNDVNIIAGMASNLRQSAIDDGVSADLKTIEDTAKSLATISDRTQRIQQLVTENPTDSITHHLPESLERSLERVRADAPEATITVESTSDTDVAVDAPSAFPIAVADVVEQLVENNRDSLRVDVSVTGDRHRNASSDDSVVVRIDDDGDGLPELDVDALENDEETPLEHGKGLSLWCLEWVVTRANGVLDVHPDDATVRIRLPQSA